MRWTSAGSCGGREDGGDPLGEGDQLVARLAGHVERAEPDLVGPDEGRRAGGPVRASRAAPGRAPGPPAPWRSRWPCRSPPMRRLRPKSMGSEGSPATLACFGLPVIRFRGLLWSVFSRHSRSARAGSIFPSTVEIRPALTARCTADVGDPAPAGVLALGDQLLLALAWPRPTHPARSCGPQRPPRRWPRRPRAPPSGRSPPASAAR